MRWAPVLFLPAPMFGSHVQPFLSSASARQSSTLPFDFRLTPHYPAKSPLDDVFRLVIPGADEYITEKYAFEIMPLLREWSRALTATPPATGAVAKFLDASIEATSLLPNKENKVRSGEGIEVFRRRFTGNIFGGASSRERFLVEINNYFAGLRQLETAEFEIVGIEEIAAASPTVKVAIRYDFVGTRTDGGREQRVGQWQTQWARKESETWRALRWEAVEEIVSRAREPIFIDVTSQALAQTKSYKNQMLHGVDYWRTVLDGAFGIDVYGNNGVAVGDFDNDGFDDLLRLPACRASEPPLSQSWRRNF